MFWYVFRVGGGAPRYRHTSFFSAVTEAKRLLDTVGGEYQILKCEAEVKPAPAYIVVDHRSTKPVTEPPF